jgi:hypothetical protein
LSRWIRISSSVGQQHHPVEPWVRISHTASALVILMGLGYMLRAHVLPGLKLKERIKSGLGVLSVFGVLTVTALGILYSGESGWNGFMTQVHDWIGLGTPALLLFHAWKRTQPRRATGRRH